MNTLFCICKNAISAKWGQASKLLKSGVPRPARINLDSSKNNVKKPLFLCHKIRSFLMLGRGASDHAWHGALATPWLPRLLPSRQLLPIHHRRHARRWAGVSETPKHIHEKEDILSRVLLSSAQLHAELSRIEQFLNAI